MGVASMRSGTVTSSACGLVFWGVPAGVIPEITLCLALKLALFCQWDCPLTTLDVLLSLSYLYLVT